MKKSSLILLGYGLGYIIISLLIATKCISLTTKDLLPLSIASLLFALAEFFNFGGKLILLTLRQLAFHFFATIAYKRFNTFKKYYETKYLKKQNNFLFDYKLYTYWYPKSISNHFASTIYKQYTHQNKTSVLSILLYITAPIALVVLFTTVPNNILQTSESFSNSISLFPLGLMFINVFLDSEYSHIMNLFNQNIHNKYELLKKTITEFEKKYDIHPQNE